MNALSIFLGVIGVPQALLVIGILVFYFLVEKKIPELMKGIGSEELRSLKTLLKTNNSLLLLKEKKRT